MTDLVDEFCDPSNPKRIKFDDVLIASRRIAGAVIRTPCSKAHMSEQLGVDIYLKQEFLQKTGSFKERGARNALMCLSDEQKKLGVVSASTGNHGLALSYHSALLSIPCIIVMPTTASISKARKIETFGGKVICQGANIKEAYVIALGISKEKKMCYINGYDHPHVIEGQGSVGIEILEQVPTVEAILVPVGGGGLLAGLSIAVKQLKPDTEIYGIETEKTCSMTESLRKNERVFLPIDTTIADGLAVNTVGANSFHNVRGIIDKMSVVKEDWVARAMIHIVEEEKFVVEGAGAVTVAAVMASLFPNLKGKKVVCILSGGNIPPTILARALERGMSCEGRLVQFKVTVYDRPGGMAEVCGLLSGLGVTIRDCVPERAWVKGDVFSCELRILAETRGWDHLKEMIEQVKKHYKDCVFPEMGDRVEKSAGGRRGPCLAPNPVCMQK